MMRSLTFDCLLHFDRRVGRASAASKDAKKCA
jgi:hypothetical protein